LNCMNEGARGGLKPVAEIEALMASTPQHEMAEVVAEV